MAELFKDILPSILQTKVDVFEDGKDYIPYLVNKALSYHPDCLFYAQDMNLLPRLSKHDQYSFFLNIIKPYKRGFVKWAKPEEREYLQAVKMYFGYSDAKASDAIKVLTDEQLAYIKKRTTMGE